MSIRVSLLLATLTVTGLTAGSTRQEPAAAPLPSAEGRAANLRAYTELLRRDIRTQKVALVTELMQFTEREDEAFWPIYRQYEIEQSRIYDDRLKLIQTYANTYMALGDSQADQLVAAALDIESRRTDLKKRYYAALKAAMSPRTAARAVQIEHQLDLLVELQVAASLPVVPAK